MSELCSAAIGEHTHRGTVCETDFLDLNDKTALLAPKGERAGRLWAACKTEISTSLSPSASDFLSEH